MHTRALIAIALTLTACTPASNTPTATNPTTPTSISADSTTPGNQNTRTQLATLRLAPESATPYDRDLFPHWADHDQNGCDTRRDILIAQSTTAITISDNCYIDGGTWWSAYDNTYTTWDDTQIDHLVALAEAWRSGADTWNTQQRENYANDTRTPGALIAVSAASNQDKSDHDPSTWMPQNTEIWCQYLTNWINVKATWNLSIDQAEHDAISKHLESC